MILVDSSVWIDHLKDDTTPQVERLRHLIRNDYPLLVPDIVLCEVLQGLRDEREAATVENVLREFDIVSIIDTDLAVRAATNYRFLRGKGITVKKTIDLIIGTFCIEAGHLLLHDDRDFEPMSRYLGLKFA